MGLKEALHVKEIIDNNFPWSVLISTIEMKLFSSCSEYFLDSNGRDRCTG